MFRLQKNMFHGYEDELVKKFINSFKDVYFNFGENFILGKYYEQIRVPEIGRISDLIIKCEDSRLINIEFKLNDYACVLNQAKDHLKWADYSYICVPVNSIRTYPHYFYPELLECGIGLIVGNNDTFIEILRARHNTYKKGKRKPIRLNVLEKTKKIDFTRNDVEIEKYDRLYF